MLQKLKQVLINGSLSSRVQNPYAVGRDLQIAQSQLGIAERAVLLVRAMHADISALRLDGSDSFQGTGSCEFGHEDVGVTLDWPNLAILTDDARALLDELEKVSQLKYWYVFFGDCEHPFRCEAEDREAALEIFGEAFPGVKPLCVVPANEFGGLVLHVYNEDFVHCPKCGSRTEFDELPKPGYQIHVCVRCSHNFVAVPEEDDDTPTHAKFSMQPLGNVAGTAPQKDVASGVGEVIADIAFTAGNMQARGEFETSDSRDLMSDIIFWANRFEEVFEQDKHSDDYMELVDDYARYCLLGDEDQAQKLLDTMKGDPT